MKKILNNLMEHQALSREEAQQILMDIAADKYHPMQVASFLTCFVMRKIQLQELAGFRDALRALSLKVDLGDRRTMDLCGTGGDGKNTFNISTLTAFVLAGAGVKVSKHGNYGVSSICGSSNVLEALGIQFTEDAQVLREQLDIANLCFLHAPLFHPAMKAVAPIRKALGVKTFFNQLGPLVNPASPQVQMVGVYDLSIARMYQYLFQQDKGHEYSILHALDGFDEISLTADFKWVSVKGEQIADASLFGFKPLRYESLYGGETVEEAAEIFKNILNLKGTESQNNVIIANATVGIKTYFPHYTLQEAQELATHSLYSQKALGVFNILKNA